MSEIFISYKREDEARVSQLVRALERSGLSAWWDRGLAGGESWRQQIQGALDAAQCVIVVWTHQSVGPAGDFVRDEAAHAKRRSVLVPVMLDKVALPLGFRELQAIDLTRWNGSPRDPFFQDLCAAVTAKLDGHPAPPAKGPMKRLQRRLAYSSLASAIAFGCVAFGVNAFRVQESVCAISLLQPQISDTCGALGLGHRPTKAERIAWEGRLPGNCAALRAHVERFPGGLYRALAADMVAARRATQTATWTPARRHLRMFVAQGDASPTSVSAQAAALARGRVSAERMCRGLAATMSSRFISATAAPENWQCTRLNGGATCGFDGEALCDVEEPRVQEGETCGEVKEHRSR
jgi:hypothetical protein